MHQAMRTIVSGAMLLITAFAAVLPAHYDLDCTTMLVDGISYSDCDGVWYQPAYSGGDVTYVVVDPPPGD